MDVKIQNGLLPRPPENVVVEHPDRLIGRAQLMTPDPFRSRYASFRGAQRPKWALRRDDPASRAACLRSQLHQLYEFWVGSPRPN